MDAPMIQKNAEPAPAIKNNGKENKPTPVYNWARPISLPFKRCSLDFFFNFYNFFTKYFKGTFLIL